jgi:hypothetical protein
MMMPTASTHIQCSPSKEKTEVIEKEEESPVSVLNAVAAGVVSGAAAGVLIARQRGKKTKKRIGGGCLIVWLMETKRWGSLFFSSFPT